MDEWILLDKQERTISAHEATAAEVAVWPHACVAYWLQPVSVLDYFWDVEGTLL